MGFSAIVCVLSNNFHLQIWIFFSKWTTTTTIFFGSIFLMEITHIESALEMGGYSAESGSISSLKNTNVSSISVPILLHTVSVFYEKKIFSIHQAIFKHYMVPFRRMMRSHIFIFIQTIFSYVT